MPATRNIMEMIGPTITAETISAAIEATQNRAIRHGARIAPTSETKSV
jgi:hypothetical protein